MAYVLIFCFYHLEIETFLLLLNFVTFDNNYSPQYNCLRIGTQEINKIKKTYNLQETIDYFICLSGFKRVTIYFGRNRFFCMFKNLPSSFQICSYIFSFRLLLFCSQISTIFFPELSHVNKSIYYSTYIYITLWIHAPFLLCFNITLHFFFSLSSLFLFITLSETYVSI